jgi:hypothetical protein
MRAGARHAPRAEFLSLAESSLRTESYWVGLAVCLVAFSRVALMEAEPWLVVGRRIITALVPAATG